jgi:aryl-alcohol dehydrogenase-like predicted oxidoreductase
MPSAGDDCPAGQRSSRLRSTQIGQQVSALGLGCMGLNDHRSATLDRSEAVVLIRAAVDLGVTFFDTAQTYRPFTSEQLVGRTCSGS